MKSVSGHDLVPFEVKFGLKGQARIDGLILLTSNHAINPSTKSEYISQYRRLVNIFFSESISNSEAQPNFSEKLIEEVILFILFSHYLQTFSEKKF
jgi:phage/plasmid-associated DNA primase